jgi:hypothetical protein
MHCVCLKALLSGTPSVTWHALTSTQTGTSPWLLWQSLRPNLQLPMQVWFGINIFQDTLLHTQTSQLGHYHAPCSNQCSGVSDSALFWCHLNCMQDNELRFYKGKAIWRQSFPLWSLVAVRLLWSLSAWNKGFCVELIKPAFLLQISSLKNFMLMS